MFAKVEKQELSEVQADELLVKLNDDNQPMSDVEMVSLFQWLVDHDRLDSCIKHDAAFAFTALTMAKDGNIALSPEQMAKCLDQVKRTRDAMLNQLLHGMSLGRDE